MVLSAATSPAGPIMPGVLIVEALAQVGAVAALSHPDNKGKLGLFAGIDKGSLPPPGHTRRSTPTRGHARAAARPRSDAPRQWRPWTAPSPRKASSLSLLSMKRTQRANSLRPRSTTQEHEHQPHADHAGPADPNQVPPHVAEVERAPGGGAEAAPRQRADRPRRLSRCRGRPTARGGTVAAPPKIELPAGICAALGAAVGSSAACGGPPPRARFFPRRPGSVPPPRCPPRVP